MLVDILAFPATQNQCSLQSQDLKTGREQPFKDGGLVAHSRTEHHNDVMSWKEFEMS